MVRKAKLNEVKEIQKLINFYAEQGLMLPRSLNDLYDNLHDYFVYEEKGEILGTCALHICWEDLAEIKSLAVEKLAQGKGIATKLVKEALKEAKTLGIKRVFVLTYEPAFFQRFAFVEIDKSKLPQKIWGECVKCVKFPDCKEVALIKEI
ncbi:MAG: N-acetyltransferase [Candidatus Omnitrophica bacterium]|nr:N-acetyltransferase [Candidatus Omnitrophota bacterium]MCM8798336.1 N-acetyltransferase [Candidatus Omnitrophota bacterium]